jgi:uncharacterized membrane protein YqiK
VSGDHGLVLVVTLLVLVLMTAGVAVVLARCYRRCRADEALVRTGAGPIRVVIGGGIMAFPGMHQVQSVSLRPVRVPVEARGREAVRTHENIKVELTLDLDLHVSATQDDVLAAARTFGERAIDAASVREWIEIRAREMLRRAAYEETFFDLWDRREHVCERVGKDLRDDLGKLGLTLRAATLSGFAMVPIEQLDSTNMLDCSAKRTLLELTQPHQLRILEIEHAARLERLEREAKEKIQALDAEVARLNANARVQALSEEQAQKDALAARDRGAGG